MKDEGEVGDNPASVRERARERERERIVRIRMMSTALRREFILPLEIVNVYACCERKRVVSKRTKE